MIKIVQGRPRVGRPISITITDEQKAWLEARRLPGESLCMAVRRVLSEAMKTKKEKT